MSTEMRQHEYFVECLIADITDRINEYRKAGMSIPVVKIQVNEDGSYMFITKQAELEVSYE